ncbi:hypothetical protein OU994_28260 [Pseudoduganella sp. SL102]|uniref:hypothetical protein n=1 Tax=Pseudoduganella sp. SL102 TaxID=2995154 RepID=UPI00248BB0D7|nr:hypothetical protein [Pseudoduganella sp. SL102]WBS02104.1 hypothetical protein OU994_28260 [Pseudoduganella sp. SL102]
MRIDEVSEFLGLPVENKEFDAFLTEHGIQNRPVFKGTPVENIILPKQGLVLKFDTRGGYQRRYGPQPEEGGMIFSSVQVYGAVNDSCLAQYPGALPYGLSFKSTLEDALGIFKESTVNHQSGRNWVHVWYGYRGHTLALCFLPDSEGISFLALSRLLSSRPSSSIDG